MHLILHLTTRCNLRCRYCYSEPARAAEMSFETVKSAIALAMRQEDPDFPKDSIGVGFYGGEPLLRRELIYQTMQYCRQLKEQTGQDFQYRITTNGLLLDEKFLTNPDTAEILIAFSHDGVKTAHDANRTDAAGRGSYDRLEEKLDLLLRYRPESFVMMTLTPETISHYADSVAFLFQRGFRNFACALNYGATWTPREVAELKQQYGKLAEWYYDRTIKQEKFYFAPFDMKIATHVCPESCKGERCELGREQVAVAPSGRIYPCVQFVGDDTGGEFCIGQVETGIDETARRKLYELNVEEKASCAECAIRLRCNHYCGCLNKQATGRVDQVSPLLCAHERMVLPIADRLAERLFKKRNMPFIRKHYEKGW